MSMIPPRFLFLLYHYPPLPGISPKRNDLISGELIKKSAFSIVFTSAPNLNGNITNPKVRIEKIPMLDYRSVVRKNNASGAISEENKAGKWFQRSIKLLNTFPFSVLMAEGGFIYLANIISRGNTAIRRNKITHIYSSFRPFVDHIGAYMLKRLHPDVYWIADFRDLLVDPYFNHLYFNKSHQSLFKSIFKRADVITTVSEGLAVQLKKYNPNVIVVKNGIVNFSEQFIPSPTSLFTMAYTGSMYLDKKNARPLFVALKELLEENKLQKENLSIIYAGKDPAYWQKLASAFDLDSLLDIRGVLSTEDAVDIQKKACINILLSISSDEQTGILTGKMIEYFAAGNPILAIVAQQIDPELEQLLYELNIGKSYSDQSSDIQGIKDFIFKEYTYWKASGTNRVAVDVEILKNKYAIEKTMRPLYEKIGPFFPLPPEKGDFSSTF